jgi:NAD(P)-dependent dehydrogenase (short-subunit alcohol dehydrogenase family)
MNFSSPVPPVVAVVTDAPTPRVAIVTGATSGIGRWIALGLAQAGFRVILICRDMSRGAATSEWINQRSPGARIELRRGDLSSLEATRRVGQEIAADFPAVHVLVNNAGMFTARRQMTAEGREAVLAVNHLAPMVLTDALEDALRSGAPARVINVGSSTSDRARIDPDNLELTRGWGMLRSYSQSKLAIMMATFTRAERLASSGVTVNVVHPGAVATGLIRERGVIGLAWRLMAPFMRTEQQGAETPLHVALSSEWATLSGKYVKDRREAKPNRRALDPALLAKVEAASRVLLRS